MNTIKLVHQWICGHVFVGTYMHHRDTNGMVRWSCSKCGKEYAEECGLDFGKHEQITGPWIKRQRREG